MSSPEKTLETTHANSLNGIELLREYVDPNQLLDELFLSWVSSETAGQSDSRRKFMVLFFKELRKICSK